MITYFQSTLPESGSEGVVHDPHGQLHGAEEEAQEEHPSADLII